MHSIQTSSILVILMVIGAMSCDDPEPFQEDAADQSDSGASDVLQGDIENSPDASVSDCPSCDDSDFIDEDASAIPCTSEHRPIVFVHGMLGAGDQFHGQSMRFANNGYCPEDIVAFDWNTLGFEDNMARLDTALDDVRARTGSDRIDLVGHSMGGRLCYDYLEVANQAAKVAHYAHVASLYQSGPAGPEGTVPTLNLWSEADTIIGEKGDIEGATNVMLPGLDHAAVLTSAESFETLFRFFNEDVAPGTTEFGSESEIRLSGKVLSLGDNEPAEGGRVDVYAFDAGSGLRQSDSALARFTIGSDGSWGPFLADPEVYYEFNVQSPGTFDPPIHYYREPFVRSSHLVYYRVLPDPSSVTGILLGEIPLDDARTVLGVFFPNTALLAGRDSLEVEGLEVATETFAPATETALAFFFFDANENGTTDATSIGEYDRLPFLVGVDMALPSNPPAAVEATYNGRTLRARNWPSASQGMSFLVFE